MAMSTKEILERARCLILNKANWIKGSPAHNAYGITVRPESPEAAKFCAIGAVTKTLGGGRNLEVEKALNSAAVRVSKGRFNSLVSLNDGTDHETTLKMFDEAVKRA